MFSVISVANYVLFTDILYSSMWFRTRHRTMSRVEGQT